MSPMQEISRIGRVSDPDAICAVINAAAQIYRGVIPDACWHEPYMSVVDLENELDDGVVFWGVSRKGQLLGVMGFQARGAVDLIRHAYVRPGLQRTGMGRTLLEKIHHHSSCPILVGTWAGAYWAIRFYERNGYRRLNPEHTSRLLDNFWRIPKRQADASVVLAYGDAFERLRLAGEV